MPIFKKGDVELYYEEHGSGFPILMIALGGMESAIPVWVEAPWDPIAHLSPHYRVIAMDQRNAGKSWAPISANDGWRDYTADQLALMDHLGIDRFHVAGMCIGGPYIMSLIQAAPQRIASGVVFQTIGLDNNREFFYEMFDTWADEKKPLHPEAGEQDWSSFRQNMFGGDFLFSVSREFVSTCRTPLLVLMGRNRAHPLSSSVDLANLAKNTQVVEHWREPESQPKARAAVERFLAEHTPPVAR